MLIANTEEWRTYMQAALDRGWSLAMLIQIHQKAAHFGEGSISTSSHMNQAVEQENKDQNMHVTEPEPQGIADQVGEKEDTGGLRMHLRRSGPFYTTLVVVDMGSRQPTTQSVTIWYCVMFVDFLLLA